MPPEPIRHEPGPRDWTPVGWDNELVVPPRTRPRPRPRPSSRSKAAGPVTATILGVAAVAVGAFAAPNSDGSSTVVLSTIGLLAIIVGVATRPRAAYRAGWRRVFSTVGIALGALALVSTVFTVANSTWQTTFPTLHDATRAALQEQPADESASPVLQAPTTESDITIASVEQERVYLTEVLTRVSALIAQHQVGNAPPVLAGSTASYPHMTDDGRVAIGSVSRFAINYSAGPSGGYLLVLTGNAFATVAQYDSVAGTITLR